MYGQAVSKSGAAVTSVGSADGNLLKIGRIELQDGEFPQHDSEIALEASALSKLGKNYTIGQEIDFTVLFDAESEESVEGIKSRLNAPSRCAAFCANTRAFGN